MTDPKFTYKDDTHEYFYDGQKLFGVTSVLKDINPYNETYQKNVDKAAERGKEIHFAIELYNKYDYIEIEDDLRPYFDQYLEFKRAFNHKSIHNEKLVYSDLYKYGGTVDSVGEIDIHGKELVLIDYKTTSKFNYNKTGLQLSAYRQALKEEGIIVNGGILLWLQKDKYKVLIYTAEQLDEMFEHYKIILQSKKIIKFYNEN